MIPAYLRRHVRDLVEEIRWIVRSLTGWLLRHRPFRSPVWWGGCAAAGALLFGLGWIQPPPRNPVSPPPPSRPDPAVIKPISASLGLVPPTPLPPPDYLTPVRDIPTRFAINTTMPRVNESKASQAIADVWFDPDRDLIRVEDTRVWWESDHDDREKDTEEDRIMHWAMEDAFRRLVELVVQEGGRLKVQDTYRDQGIHNVKSLHKQGRAIDLTSENMSLSRLACLAWAAGFDWVYFEKSGGLHIHASVSPQGKIRRTFDRADYAGP